MQNILITGAAGFIGSNLIDCLLGSTTYTIYAVDNFDPFYDPKIKLRNISNFINNPRVKFFELDICNRKELFSEFAGLGIDAVVHLAAKAGVRPSIADPIGYETVNVLGTQNLLDLAQELNLQQFVFASSSSVYGVNPKTPWVEDDAELEPISPYAATKLTGEFLGSIYSRLNHKNFIGLRFFTVYGPRQRPDLAIHKFTNNVLLGQEIEQYGDGTTLRDYTYIDDIVNGIVSALHYRDTRFEIVNLGNNAPVTLNHLINTIAVKLNKEPIIKILPEQPGDVPATYADISKAKKILRYSPVTKLEDGIELFVKWFIEEKQKDD